MGGTCLELVNKRCYLGNMIGAGSGAEDASRTRVRCSQKKFEPASVLTLRRASHRLNGKICNSCVTSAMAYGSETRPIETQ